MSFIEIVNNREYKMGPCSTPSTTQNVIYLFNLQCCSSFDVYSVSPSHDRSTAAPLRNNVGWALAYIWILNKLYSISPFNRVKQYLPAVHKTDKNITYQNG